MDNLTDKEAVQGLLAIVGPSITTALGLAKSTAAMRMWLAGAPCPNAAALHAAYHAAAAIARTYGEEAARSWFCSSNADLDGNSPLMFLREHATEENLERIVALALQDAH